MTAPRAAVLVALVVGLAAGCTGSGDGKTTSAAPSAPSPVATTPPAGPCTVSSAVPAKFTLVSQSGFAPSCVRIKAKAQFLFINNVKQRHSVATKPGAPVSFDVQLPVKTSTYAATFKKKGKYVIVDKTTDKEMTLFVT